VGLYTFESKAWEVAVHRGKRIRTRIVCPPSPKSKYLFYSVIGRTHSIDTSFYY